MQTLLDPPIDLPDGESTNSAGVFKRRFKLRNRIEIMFNRLKDGRRGATLCDRYRKVLPTAIALAATVIYCL